MDVQGIMPRFEHRRLRKHATVFDKMLSTTHFEDEATNKLPTLSIRIGAVVIAPFFQQCALGSIPGLGVMRRLSLLVLYSALKGCSLSTPAFPSAQKRHFISFD